jgi:polar amino acid transport system substrate-binding protein
LFFALPPSASDFIALLAATLCVAPLASCAGGPPDEDTLQRILRTGTVRVGYANEAPYAYLDPSSSRVSGEAPEVARAVMSALGATRVEGVLTEFGSLIPGLRAGRFDLIAAGMYITPERCQQVAFSEPTFCVGEAFVVAAGNPLELHGYEDVAAHEAARVGVVAGTVEHGYARRLGVPESRVLVFPDAPSAIAGVEAGRVDAFAGTSLTVADLLAKRSSIALERATPFRQPVIDGVAARGCGAFALRRSDQELLAAINRKLDGFIGTAQHLSLVEPFGFTRAELPVGVTTTALCLPWQA